MLKEVFSWQQKEKGVQLHQEELVLRKKGEDN